MAADVQDSLFEQQLKCVHCHRGIDTTGNHQPTPPAHVHCAFRARPTPSQRVEPDREIRRWLDQLSWLGYVIRGNWREYSAATAEAPYRVAWDIPAAERANPAAGPHCGWLDVAQTPCPGDPSTPWDEPPTNGAFLCREKHAHPILRRNQLATTPDLQPVMRGGVR